MKLKFILLCVALVMAETSALSSQTAGTVENLQTAVPRLVNFSGHAADANGKSISGVAGVTFAIYREQQGGAPLWLETQNVNADAKGNFMAQLGAAKPDGLPIELFTSGEARWLGVSVNGGAEQARILLMSVPYALKAADAQTLNGLPASAFALAAPTVANGSSVPTAVTPTSVSGSAPPPATSNVTTTGGTVNAIPLFTTATNVQNSILTQAGTTTINVVGKLNLPAIGAATTTAGKNSRPEAFVASVFNSTTSTAVPQIFQWQAEPANNNTATASGVLSLLYASGTATPAETGLRIGPKGIIGFAPGQTFPGTGAGTITGVTTAAGSGLSGGGTTGTLNLTLLNTCTANQILRWSGTAWACANSASGGVTSVASGAGLTGGPITSTGTLSIATAGVSNAMLQNSSVSLNAGTGLTGGGAVSLGGATTLSLDTTKIPLLALSNTFPATQIFGADIDVGGDLRADVNSLNTGGDTPGLRFGAGNTGQGIASGNASAPNPNGLDFYTAGISRVSITKSGFVGIGTSTPTAALHIAPTGPQIGLYAVGYSAPSGSGYPGGTPLVGIGGNSDPTVGVYGGNGIEAYGGIGSTNAGDGIGGVFYGGTSAALFGDGIDAYAGSGFAGYFTGAVYATGAITAVTHLSKVDHPLDPANKYLSHSSVESSDMKNMYDGIATLDANGEAVVQMPDWFGAMNRDFRYQITCLGGFAPVYVAEELADNHFKISGGRPGMRVSWQITGIRHDAWANAHRVPTEELKNDRERGFYLHPELYGAPEEKQIGWARHPQQMQKVKQRRALTGTTAPGAGALGKQP